jgi:hypothetical protein
LTCADSSVQAARSRFLALRRGSPVWPSSPCAPWRGVASTGSAPCGLAAVPEKVGVLSIDLGPMRVQNVRSCRGSPRFGPPLGAMTVESESLSGLFDAPRHPAPRVERISRRARRPATSAAPSSATRAILLDDPLVVAALQRAGTRVAAEPRSAVRHALDDATERPAVAKARRRQGARRLQPVVAVVGALIALTVALSAGGDADPRDRRAATNAGGTDAARRAGPTPTRARNQQLSRARAPESSRPQGTAAPAALADPREPSPHTVNPHRRVARSLQLRPDRCARQFGASAPTSELAVRLDVRLRVRP